MLKIYIIFQLMFNGVVWARNDSKDLILSNAEYAAMQKFKPLVWDNLKEPFMKSEFYLIRWLRKAKLDLPKARQDLFDAISWRKQNNISQILSEDWSDLVPDYTMSFDGHDKMGRPLLCFDLGDWDVRGASIKGLIPRLHRYLTYSAEKSIQRVFEAQQEGKNVTRFVVLTNVDGFNFRQHGCPSCSFLLVQWVIESFNFYPYFTDELIIFNMSPVGAQVLNVIRAAAPPEVQHQIKAFDGNKDVWMKYLDEQIDRSEIKISDN